MISDKLAAEIINTAIKTGCDFAEIYNEDKYVSMISVENGKVETLTSSNISGIGLRLLKGYQSVYSYTNDVSRKSLLKLAHDLSLSFNDNQMLDNVEKFHKVHHKNFFNPCTSLFSVDKKEIIDLLKHLNKIVKDYDPRIVKAENDFSMELTDVNIFNSKGEKHTKHTEYGRTYILSVASENGKLETRFDGPGSQSGWEYFKNTLDLEGLARENAQKVIMMLEAKECPSGKFPVIIGNGWGGVIFHEACGHQLEASAVSKNLSVFSNMLGQKIASDIVTAYDNGTIPNAWGSNIIDDEGHETQNNLLIENGILKGYLIDDFNGRRMNMKGNGACRRQNYKYEPTSRMSNTYIAAGKSTPEEIISNTKLALYAVSFNGGSVNPVTGEFNFGCSEAYIVRDGKICEPVRGATLVGKATEILKHIDMVGNDLDHGQGMCGAASGSIPTNVGQPTIRIDEIVVGGRGGSIDEYK